MSISSMSRRTRPSAPVSITRPTNRSGLGGCRQHADRTNTFGHVAVNPHAGQPDRKHHGGPVGPLAGKVGGRLGRTERLQCNVDHHRVQVKPPRPLFGRRRQPDGGPSRTGARDGEADDALERRTMLLTGASQPPIKVVRIQPGRRRLVDLRRLLEPTARLAPTSRWHVASTRMRHCRNGSQRGVWIRRRSTL